MEHGLLPKTCKKRKTKAREFRCEGGFILGQRTKPEKEERKRFFSEKGGTIN